MTHDHHEVTDDRFGPEPDVQLRDLCELPEALRSASFKTLDNCAQPTDYRCGEPYLTFNLLPADEWADLLELLISYDAEHGLPEGYLDRAHTAEGEQLKGAWHAELHTELRYGRPIVSVAVTMPQRDLRPLRAALDWVASLPVATSIAVTS